MIKNDYFQYLKIINQIQNENQFNKDNKVINIQEDLVSKTI